MVVSLSAKVRLTFKSILAKPVNMYFEVYIYCSIKWLVWLVSNELDRAKRAPITSAGEG